MRKFVSLLLTFLFVFILIGCSSTSTKTGTKEPTKTGEEHTHSYVLVEEVQPSCTLPGCKSFYLCSDCAKTFDLDKNEVSKESLVIPALGHTMTHVDRQEATENETGILEHYHCEVCGKNFTDSEGKNPIDDVTIPVIGHSHTLVKVDAVEATCTIEGTVEHYHCEECGKNFEDEAGTKELATIIIPASHKLTKIEGKAATCTEKGIAEHYHCEVCNKDFADENGQAELESVELPLTSHSLSKVDAKAATCTEAGSKEHYHCSVCNKDFEDEAGTKELTDLVVAALGHTVTKVDAKAATCTEAGEKEHYHCSVCNKDFEDQAGTKEITDLSIAALGHKLTKVDGKAATCIEAGSKEHYHCSVCNKDFEDQAGTKELTDLVIKALGHTKTFVAEVSASCTADGTKAHYHCSVCNKDFEDEACTKELTDLVIKATGHEYETVIENEVKATCTQAGSYDEVSKCKHCGAEESRETKYTSALGHTWGEGSVTTRATCTASGVMTYTCSVCHDTKTEVIPATGHDYKDEVVAPTCHDEGYTLHKCNNCNESYKDTVVPKLEHKWVGTVTCTTGRTCSLCGDTEEALGHNYVKTGEVKATCTAEGTETYKCSRCNDEYTIKVSDALGHDFTGATQTEKLVLGKTCEYVVVLKCKTCQEEIVQETVYHHSYVATVTKEATCKEKGTKTYVCTLCGAAYEEDIPVNELGHNWVLGDVVAGKRTDECSICHETRTVTVYTGEATDINEFKDQEIELTNASLKLDDGVIEEIGNKEITLAVDKIDDAATKESLGLSPEQLAQVGDNPIYDFSMKSGDETISQFGENNFITVTLPYTLSDGEDVDSIAVWYINDQGELTSIEASYSNGYVTFQTNHFSYYTVTKLTPEERCELYGHNYATKEVIGDCINDSYILYVCQRCHETHKEVTETAPGHDFVLNESLSSAATCTASGKNVYECSHCHKTTVEVIKALGHDLVETEKAEPTCDEKGYTKFVCSHCGKEYFEYVDALGHEYTETTVDATCTDYGYTLHTCSKCNHQYVTDEVNPLGHDYEAVFTFSNDHLSCKVTLTCANDETHTVTLDALVEVEIIKATCSVSGDIVYKATATYEGKVYTDSYVITGITLDHTPGEEQIEDRIEATCKEAGGYYKVIRCTVCGEIIESEFVEIPQLEHVLGELLSDKNGHYYICSLCQEEVGREAHTFTETVVTAATCGADGLARFTCTCGYSFDKTIPATGEHNYEDGVCTICGKVYQDCDHSILHQECIDLAEHGCCGGKIYFYTCDCGEVVEFDGENGYILCEYDQMSVESGTLPDGTEYYRITCPVCGLVEYETMQEFERGCEEVRLITVQLFDKNGGQLVYGTFEYTNEYHAETESKQLVLDNEGSMITYRVCKACGEVVDFSESNVRFVGDWVEEDSEEMIDNFTKVITNTMTKGDVVLTRTETYTINGCNYHEKIEYTATLAGETKLYYSEEDDDVEHTYEYTYTLLGDTCADGYIEHAVCSVCGYVSDYHGRGHRYDSVTLDLSEKGCCQDIIAYQECRICGDKKGSMFGMKFACQFDSSTAVTTEYVENGIKYQKSVMTCTECGLQMTYVQWQVIDGCHNRIYMSFEFDKGEMHEEVKDLLISESETHEWTIKSIEFENPDKGCEGGYLIIEECSKCGEVIRHYDWGHETHYDEINLHDLGCCDGYISYEVCDRCGLVRVTGFNSNCKLSEAEFTTYTDEDGHVHTVATQTCSVCGLVVVSDSYVDVDGCIERTYGGGKFVKGDETIIDVPLYLRFTEAKHDYVAELTFTDPELGCVGGYTGTVTCSKCGEAYHTSGDSHTKSSGEYGYDEIKKFTDENGNVLFAIAYSHCELCDMCTDFVYQFGSQALMQSLVETHDYVLVEDGITYTGYHGYSEEYGLDIVWVWITKPYTTCISRDFNRIIFTYNGEVIFNDKLIQTMEEHNYIEEIRFNDEDEKCTGGFYYKKYCTACGEVVDEYQGNKHEYRYDRYYLEDEKYGTLFEIEYEYCHICGELHVNYCQVYNDDLLERLEITETIDGITYNGYKYTYNGNKQVILTRLMAEDNSDPCYTKVCQKIILVENGETILDGLSESLISHHTYVYEGTFDTDTHDCESGVTVHRTCSVCGDTEMYHTKSHSTYDEQVKVFADGMCNPVYVRLETCMVCGKVSYISADYFADVHNVEYSETEYVDDETGITHRVFTQTCTRCGVTRIVDRYAMKDENCFVTEHEVHRIIFGNETLFEREVVQTYYSHNHQYVYEMNGESCDDGYHVKDYCRDCGKLLDEYDSRGHRYENTYEVLKDSDGQVIVEVGMYKCTICGLVNDFWMNINDDIYYNSIKVGPYEEERDGKVYTVTIMSNESAGFMYRIEEFEVSLGDCEYKSYRNIKIWIENELKFDTDCVLQYRRHNYVDTCVFDNDDHNCDNGVEITHVCQDCGYSYTEHRYFHNYLNESHNYAEEYPELGKLIITKRTCDACGRVIYDYEYSFDTEYTSNYFVDDDGVEHHVYARTNTELGYRFQCDEYTLSDGCLRTTHQEIIISLNGEILASYDDSYTNKQHEYIVTYEFDGAQNCEEGVTYTYTCKYCGESYTYHYNYHCTDIKDVIDFRDLGSLHAGHASIQHCACGKELYVSVYDCECDFNSDYEAVTDDDPLFIRGYKYVYTCASTDPLCGFSYAEVYKYYYYNDESCRYYLTLTYLFGYNTEDGTALRTYIIEGDYYGVSHRYVENEYNETRDGMNIYTDEHICTRCGDVYKDVYYYDIETGVIVMREYYRTEYYEREKYQVITFGINSYALPIEKYVERTDGTWHKYEYSYPTDFCHRVVDYTNSYGNSEHYEDTEHIHYMYISWGSDNCSQLHGWGYQCVACGEVDGEFEYPNDHRFVWDDDKQTYVCSVCGLENAAGVSGTIIMEDMSDDYNFVVGYYNQGHVQFMQYVSILVGEDELFLDNVPLYEGYNGACSIFFSREDVANLAAEMGYDDINTYKVKFTFVPFGADSNYDYAIVFE